MISNFEIIGEVSSHICYKIKKNYPNIEWYKIKVMRDFITQTSKGFLRFF